MSDHKSPPLPAIYLEGHPPPGYPPQAPQPQYAEVPMKTQMRADKGYCGGVIAALCCCFLCEEDICG
uniref:Uncharacterized protein n=1 Tax=Picea sitchensis TaxID=3332 RepID=A9NY51_PICSI|nr:unknown [Picea sitchensis]